MNVLSGLLAANLSWFGGHDLDRDVELLDALGTISLSVDFHDTRLDDAAAELTRQLPVPLLVDWSALETLGIGRLDPLTMRTDGSAQIVLSSLTFHLGDEFGRPVIEAFDGQIIITGEAATAEMGHTAVYDVRDLLDDENLIDALRDSLPESEEISDEPAAPEADGTDDETSEPMILPGRGPRMTAPPDIDELLERAGPATPLTPGERLLMLLTDHVAPEAWVNFGGDRAMVTDRDGTLVITAPASIHRKIRGALESLRVARPSQLRINASIVDVPRLELERMTRRWSLDSPSLAESLRSRYADEMIWQTSSVVAFDERLVLQSESDQTLIDLKIESLLDRERGRVKLSIDVQIKSEAVRSSAGTTAEVPLGSGAVLLELPGAGRNPIVRLLILSTQTM